MSVAVRAAIDAAGATLRSKRGSPLMAVLSYLFPWRAWFLRSAWTTIGRTIYAPVWVDVEGNLEPYRTIIGHELVHVAQWRRWWVLLWLGYLLLPLPVGLAWCRWAAEREACLVQLRAGADIDAIVDVLWRRYGWPWPRCLMRRWFRRAMVS
jgi:hypothetical protein